mmetsp:Transcript_3055/g.5153  ORF Transcript_3055/g.5153 Transcript_3055/m.5153 type:complete len:200 (+) Transcript_3055:778-1377(+)
MTHLIWGRLGDLCGIEWGRGHAGGCSELARMINDVHSRLLGQSWSLGTHLGAGLRRLGHRRLIIIGHGLGSLDRVRGLGLALMHVKVLGVLDGLLVGGVRHGAGGLLDAGLLGRLVVAVVGVEAVVQIALDLLSQVRGRGRVLRQIALVGVGDLLALRRQLLSELGWPLAGDRLLIERGCLLRSLLSWQGGPLGPPHLG